MLLGRFDKGKLHECAKTADDWKGVASEIEYRWNFPNCLAAMDGKHINTVASAGSGSLFFNYKKNFQ